MTKVMLLSGGNSTEREVSLRSGKQVLMALQAGGYDVEELDPIEEMDSYEERLRRVDVVFVAIHGNGGEDGISQQWLEERHLRYVGADAASSAICSDKWRYKQMLRAADLPTPSDQLVDRVEFLKSDIIKTPFVLKPYDGGSSVDTYIVREPAHYDQATLLAAFDRHEQMLLEKLITGQEITVGVLGEEALPVVEIIPPNHAEFDYIHKYDGTTQELCPPRHVDPEIQRRAQSLALQIHRLVGVRDMSRTDMIIQKDGSLMVLETNTIPGLTAQSLYPKAAAAAGYDMIRLVTRLVEMALGR